MKIAQQSRFAATVLAKNRTAKVELLDVVIKRLDAGEAGFTEVEWDRISAMDGERIVASRNVIQFLIDCVHLSPVVFFWNPVVVLEASRFLCRCSKSSGS